ncbi:MAG: hypothetical protein AAF368_09250, partial [Planctomycetota bacterium]
GAKDPKTLLRDAQSALSQNDWPAALSNFNAALAQIDETADPSLALEAKLGQAEAQAHVSPGAARDTFLGLMKTSEVSFADFSTITTALSGSGNFEEAIALLTEGKEKGLFEDKLQSLITKVGDAAKAAGDADSMSALSGLGYVGND